MDLTERVIFFTIGGGFGFVLGYVVARLRTIEQKVDAVKNEVHEVDVIIKHERDERGSMQWPSFTTLAMGAVVLITAFAAFSASSTNNKLEDTVLCLTQFNEHQNAALSGRDDAIQDETQAEIDLWGLYNKLYEEGTLPNTPPERLVELQETLAQAIRKYRVQLIETQKARGKYEYGEPDVLKNCEERSE